MQMCASEIMKTVVLDAINSDEVVVIILPDFTKEEVQQGLEEITKRVLKLKLDESSFLATLGIGIPPFRKSSKDMKSETLCENEEGSPRTQQVFCFDKLSRKISLNSYLSILSHNSGHSFGCL